MAAGRKSAMYNINAYENFIKSVQVEDPGLREILNLFYVPIFFRQLHERYKDFIQDLEKDNHGK